MKLASILTTVLSTFCLTIFAQPQELKIVEDITTILGDNSNKITKVTVQTESEKTISLQVEFTGFKDKDYSIRGTFLNRLKKPLKELESAELELDSRSGLADFFFTFNQLPGRSYPLPYMETEFVEFSISDKKGISGLPGLESLGIGAKKFTFQFKKKWKLKGATGQEVVVTLTPYKSASTIKQ